MQAKQKETIHYERASSSTHVHYYYDGYMAIDNNNRAEDVFRNSSRKKLGPDLSH